MFCIFVTEDSFRCCSFW